MLYAVVYMSPYDNHGQGRGVCVWCNRGSTVLETRHRQLVGLGVRGRGRAETVGYLDLGLAFLLALAERDRLHEQPDELLALLKPLGRVILYLLQATPERE